MGMGQITLRIYEFTLIYYAKLIPGQLQYLRWLLVYRTLKVMKPLSMRTVVRGPFIVFVVGAEHVIGIEIVNVVLMLSTQRNGYDNTEFIVADAAVEI